jgi:hypothetical protein
VVSRGSGGTGIDPAELFGGHRAGWAESVGADAGEDCECVSGGVEGSFRRWDVIVEGWKKKSGS